MDICPQRMDAADAEAPRPPRIETAVETGVEEAADAEASVSLRIETAVEF